MPFCPKCKNEYREGFTTCSECKCDLVDSLEDYELSEKEKKEAEYARERELFAQLISGESEIDESDEESEAEENKTAHKSVRTGVYIDSESKASENKSSGWTFLIVGLAGLVAMALIMAGIIPLSLNPNAKFLIYGVMIAMFALFVVIGVISMRNSTKFERDAKSEKSLFNEMMDYCKSSLSADTIDAIAKNSPIELTEEELYFRRFEVLKKNLSEKFLNLDEAFLDNFIDKAYSEIFGGEE